MGRQLPSRTAARRIVAIRLLAEGSTIPDVARILGVTVEAIRQWKAKYDENGDAGLANSVVPRGPAHVVNDAQARRLMKTAGARGLETLSDVHTLAGKMGIHAARSSLRRKLISMGYWPA